MKRFVNFLAALLVVVGLAWLGTFLFWRSRIGVALKTLESQTVPTTSDLGYNAPSDALAVIVDAGCRALPALAASFVPSKNPAFLAAVSRLFRDIVQDQKGAEGRPEDFPWRELIESSDNVPERERKCEAHQAWWRDHGRELHRDWKVWTDRCGE